MYDISAFKMNTKPLGMHDKFSESVAVLKFEKKTAFDCANVNNSQSNRNLELATLVSDEISEIENTNK